MTVKLPFSIHLVTQHFKIRERVPLTDVSVLVVAADDGFMPQTDEALSLYAQSSLLVATNKIDVKGADIDKEDTNAGAPIVAEDWRKSRCCIGSQW